MSIMSEHLQTKLAEQWHNRAAAQGYKPGSAKYRAAELEFLAGAVSAIEIANDNTGSCIALRSSWFIAASRGEPIFKLTKEN